MFIHVVFDWLSYLASFLVLRFYFKDKKVSIYGNEKWIYYSVVIIGFVVGAILFSTINNYLTLDKLELGKSVIGAIFGAIIAVEVFKYINKIEGSTGAYFAPSLAIGIAIGRLGCFFSGLKDFTYGVKTTLPWGVDFGDGVLRHPVQLYESSTMAIFFIFSLWLYKKDRAKFECCIFYYFILVYATQRFFWEMLKPYAHIGGLTIFAWLSIALIIYATILIKRSQNGTLFK